VLRGAGFVGDGLSDGEEQTERCSKETGMECMGELTMQECKKLAHVGAERVEVTVEIDECRSTSWKYFLSVAQPRTRITP